MRVLLHSLCAAGHLYGSLCLYSCLCTKRRYVVFCVSSLCSLRGGLFQTVCLLSFSVTGFELWAAVLATGLVCTVYTTMVRLVYFTVLHID